MPGTPERSGPSITLRVQLALALALVTTSMALVLGLALGRSFAEDLNAQVELALEGIAAAARSSVEASVAELDGQLEAAALKDRFEEGRTRAYRLEAFKSAQPGLAWVGWVDDRGVARASSGAMEYGSLSAARPFMLTAAARRADGTPDGAFVAVVDPNWLGAVLRGVRETHFRVRGVDLFVVAHGGALAAQSAEGPPPQAPPFVLPADGRDAVAWEGSGALRVLSAYSASRWKGSAGTAWSVVARQPEAEALAPVARLAPRVAAVTGIALAVGWGIAALLAWRLARPVLQLAETAERIRGGERAVAFPDVRMPAEVRRLSRALGDMMTALAAQESELKSGQERLARGVAERTAELEEAGRLLKRERERLAQSLEASRIASWEADVAAGTVWLSAEWGSMLGAARCDATVPFRALYRRIARADRKRVAATLRRALNAEMQRFDIEIGVRRDDGTLFWIRSRGQITWRAADGRALRMAGTHSDITRRRLAEDELRESEAKLRLIADNLPVMINYLDCQGRYLFANRPYMAFLGFPGADLTGKRMRDVAGPEAESIALSHLPELEAGRHVTYGRKRADTEGRMRFFEIRQVPHLNAQGRLIAFYSLIEDVTARDETRRALLASEAQLRQLTDSLPTALCELDFDGRILYANRGYHRFYGLRPGGAVGKRIADIAGEETHAEFLRSLPDLREGEHLVYEREATMRGRERLQLEVHLMPRLRPPADIESVYAMIVDITARKQAEGLLQRQALTDVLTGLPNRRLLEDRVERLIARAKREAVAFGLLYLDLDDFKPVNDSLGHAAGDLLLQQAAARLSAAVREGDTVARLGGDEFVVLLAHCETAADAAGVAAKIIGALGEPFALEQGAARVSCSIGIAMFPADGESPAALLHMADVGLYAAKRAGKSRFMHLNLTT